MTIAPEKLTEITKKLFDEKKRLEAELALFTQRNVHNRDDYSAKFPDIGTKDDENAAEVSMYSDNLTLERTMEGDLKDVNKALARIEKGTYGTCRYCEAEIPLARLLIRPVSASCVACKEKFKGDKR